MVRLHSHSYSLGLTNKSKNPVLVSIHPQLLGIFSKCFHVLFTVSNGSQSSVPLYRHKSFPSSCSCLWGISAVSPMSCIQSPLWANFLVRNLVQLYLGMVLVQITYAMLSSEHLSFPGQDREYLFWTVSISTACESFVILSSPWCRAEWALVMSALPSIMFWERIITQVHSLMSLWSWWQALCSQT